MENKNRKLRLTEENLQYRSGFKWCRVPYGDIAQAYMRVEAVNAKMPRGTTNINLHFLILKLKDEKTLKLGVFRKELIKELLEQLKKKNGDIAIGYYKDKENVQE